MRSSSSNMESYGKQFAQLRLGLGFSQESLALALQIDRSTISRWESGVSKPHPEMRKRLAVILHTELDVLNTIFGYGVHLTSSSSSNEDNLVENTDWQKLLVDIKSETQSARKTYLLLIGGYPGSGKSEFGRFLSTLTGWPHLDKDVLTQPLTERLLLASSEDHTSRESEVYKTQIRPFEYQCLLETSFDILKTGVSTIVSAPFIIEFADQLWMESLHDYCKQEEYHLVFLWMKCDIKTRYKYLFKRKARRDNWKLNNWDTYIADAREFTPSFLHYLVDNTDSSISNLITQAEELIGILRNDE